MSKKCPNKKNTAAFYALLKQFPEYAEGIRLGFQEELKVSEVNDFLKKKYGKRAPQHGSLTMLSDEDYKALIADMRNRLRSKVNCDDLLDKQTRKQYVHHILTAFSRIGVLVVNGDYTGVNDCIKSLPISKGRIIPEFPDDELPALLGAVRAYCTNMSKKQKEQAYRAANN